MSEMNDNLREHFLLRPDVVFLNHGSFGACPRPVFESSQRWQRELESQPVDFLQRRLKDLLQDARSTLAGYIGADPQDVVFVTNASMGLNIVARSLKLSPGDEILTTDHEYGTLDKTWALVCEKTGAKYVQQTVSLPLTDPSEVVEGVWSGYTQRTKVLFLSHITSPTALTFPVTELVRRAREAGVISIIDGAHVPGHIPLDVTAIGADFYSGNCHKWMMSPKGAGFLHARREAHDLLEPLIGGRAVLDGTISRLLAEHQYQGTRDMSAFLAVPDAIRFMETHDWDSVRRRCHDLVRYAREAVASLTGLPPVVPDDPAWFAQMAVLPIPDCDGQLLHRRLYDEFSIEIPVTGWGGMRFVRISIQGYNTRSDVDALIRGLEILLPQATE